MEAVSTPSRGEIELQPEGRECNPQLEAAERFAWRRR